MLSLHVRTGNQCFRVPADQGIGSGSVVRAKRGLRDLWGRVLKDSLDEAEVRSVPILDIERLES
jgi:hypothetical protein